MDTSIPASHSPSTSESELSSDSDPAAVSTSRPVTKDKHSLLPRLQRKRKAITMPTEKTPKPKSAKLVTTSEVCQ